MRTYLRHALFIIAVASIGVALSPFGGGLSGRAAGASGLRPADGPLVLRPGTAMVRWRARGMTLREMPHIGGQRAARLVASDLRVPSTAFSPATIFPQYDGVEDNATADVRQFGTHAHSTTYEALGRVTGYYELASWGATTTATFVYQGSIMTDPAAARAAQQDNVTYQQAAPRNGTAGSCKTSDSPPRTIPDCSFIVTRTSDKQFLLTDYAWAVGKCLIETEAQYAASYNQTATEGQIQTTLGTITGTAGSLAGSLCGAKTSPAPTPTATPVRPTPTATATALQQPPVHGSLIDVRVEKAGTKADLNGPALLVVKAGQKVLLSMYVLIDQGAAGTPLDFSFVEKAGTKQVLSGTVHDRIPPSLPAQVRESVTVSPGKSGTYTFTGAFSPGGAAQHRSTIFIVAGSTKHRCVTISGTRYCTTP